MNDNNVSFSSLSDDESVVFSQTQSHGSVGNVDTSYEFESNVIK